MQSMICLDAYFHLFWEKKVIYGEEMQFIDPCYNTFKFKFDVKENGTTVFRGGIGKMFKYYNLKDKVYLHLNYVSKNVLLYRLFLLEGMEINYSTNGACCSRSGNIGSDVADPGADYTLVKCLTDYDVGASSLVLLSIFLITVLLFEYVFYCALILLTFLILIFSILMLLSLELHCRDLRRSIFYQMAMECTEIVQLDGPQDQNLNVIWDADGRDLSVKITYALVTVSSWKFRNTMTEE